MEILEKEIKYLLSKDEFMKLKNYLDSNCVRVSTRKHINYYIDTLADVGGLKRLGVTAKIRKKSENDFEYTIKKRLSICDDTHIKAENTISIDKQIAEAVINGELLNHYADCLKPIQKYLNNKSCPEDLSVTGELITERTLYSVCPHIDPINIDINTYFDIIDYEVEWETDKIDEARQILLEIFDKLDIRCIEANGESKNSRFFAYYKKLKIV